MEQTNERLKAECILFLIEEMDIVAVKRAELGPVKGPAWLAEYDQCILETRKLLDEFIMQFLEQNRN